MHLLLKVHPMVDSMTADGLFYHCSIYISLLCKLQELQTKLAAAQRQYNARRRGQAGSSNTADADPADTGFDGHGAGEDATGMGMEGSGDDTGNTAGRSRWYTGTGEDEGHSPASAAGQTGSSPGHQADRGAVPAVKRLQMAVTRERLAALMCLTLLLRVCHREAYRLGLKHIACVMLALSDARQLRLLRLGQVRGCMAAAGGTGGTDLVAESAGVEHGGGTQSVGVGAGAAGVLGGRRGQPGTRSTGMGAQQDVVAAAVDALTGVAPGTGLRSGHGLGADDIRQLQDARTSNRARQAASDLEALRQWDPAAWLSQSIDNAVHDSLSKKGKHGSRVLGLVPAEWALESVTWCAHVLPRLRRHMVEAVAASPVPKLAPRLVSLMDGLTRLEIPLRPHER